jgi:hypothetical protein
LRAEKHRLFGIPLALLPRLRRPCRKTAPCTAVRAEKGKLLYTKAGHSYPKAKLLYRGADLLYPEAGPLNRGAELSYPEGGLLDHGAELLYTEAELLDREAGHLNRRA